METSIWTSIEKSWRSSVTHSLGQRSLISSGDLSLIHSVSAEGKRSWIKKTSVSFPAFQSMFVRSPWKISNKQTKCSLRFISVLRVFLLRLTIRSILSHTDHRHYLFVILFIQTSNISTCCYFFVVVVSSFPLLSPMCNFLIDLNAPIEFVTVFFCLPSSFR